MRDRCELMTLLLIVCVVPALGQHQFGPLHEAIEIESGLAEVAGGTVTGLAIGDINNDGVADVVGALNRGTAKDDIGTSYLSVMLNLGQGVLAPPYQVGAVAGRETCATIIVDVDADGWRDIVAVNDATNSVSLYRNEGDATFGDGVHLPVGQTPRSVVASDVDADGDIDLVVLNTESDDVSTLLNRGDGSFSPELRSAIPYNVAEKGHVATFPYPGPTMVMADVNGDGAPDLAAPLVNGVAIMLGAGDGTFFEGPDHPGTLGYDVVLEDLNNDGAPDVAAIDDGLNSSVRVALNKGDGTWGPVASYSANFLQCPNCFYFFTSLCAGDADLDGDLDILFGSEIREGVGMVRNLGDGTFGPPEWVDGPCKCWVVEFGDLTGDGVADLVIGSDDVLRSSVRTYPVMPGEGIISPRLITQFEMIDDEPGGHRGAARADLDLDGHVDLAGVEYSEHVVELLKGTGDGSFTFPAPIPITHEDDIALEDVAIGDMNGDGLPDLVLSDTGGDNGGFNTPGRIWVVRNEGGMAFTQLGSWGMGDRYPKDVRCADMDGDGDLDVVAWASQRFLGQFNPIDRWVLVYTNDGDGVLTLTEEVLFAEVPLDGPHRAAIWPADFDGDGDVDVAATSGPALDPPGMVTILLNDGHGALTALAPVEVAAAPDSLACADFDGDGDLDLATGHNRATTGIDIQEPYLTVLHNDGAAGFSVVDEHVDTGFYGRDCIGVGDVNGDGLADLVIGSLVANVAVHLNAGDGTFDRAVKHGLTDWPTRVLLADFNEDGKTDIVSTNFSLDSVTYLENRGAACTADVNGDGLLDILDFLAFQQAFQAGDMKADCDADGRLINPLDFICFQQAFLAGCP